MITDYNRNPLPPSRFMTFDHTVRDICAYLGDPQAKTLYIAVSRELRHALNKLNLHLSQLKIKSVMLPIAANMTVDLPQDINSISKVGVCCGNGELRLIGRNDDLCAPEDEPFFKCCDCNTGDNPVETTTGGGSSCSLCTFYNVTGIAGTYWDGLGFGNSYQYLYGYTPKMWRNGTYRYEERYNRLIMGDGCDTKPGNFIIVEYNSAMEAEDYNLIPEKAFDTLRHRVAMMVKANRQPSVSDWEERRFKREWKLLKSTYDTFTLEDFLAALRSGYKSSPKR